MGRHLSNEPLRSFMMTRSPSPSDRFHPRSTKHEVPPVSVEPYGYSGRPQGHEPTSQMRISIPDPPASQRTVANRGVSISSNSSGFSMGVQHSLASSATSPNQPGTNRVSPTPFPTPCPPPMPIFGIPPIEQYFEHLRSATLAPLHNVSREDSTLFPPGSALAKHRIVYRHPDKRFAQAQYMLPDFDSVLPVSIPASWIDRDPPHRFGPGSSLAAYSGVPRATGKINPRPPLTRARHQFNQDVTDAHRSQQLMGAADRPKRRGNLPKEVTERLRGWFHDHIGHPYPSEEEKQLLVMETKLELRQISNWFINARRRKLPKLSQEAEAEARLRTQNAAPPTLAYRPA